MEVLSSIPSTVSASASGSDAAYSCTLTNMWSMKNHPVEYDTIANSAHWSPPVLVAHGTDYEMWAPDTMASPGVENVAEVRHRIIIILHSLLFFLNLLCFSYLLNEQNTNCHQLTNSLHTHP
jgi:hypothetical protein